MFFSFPSPEIFSVPSFWNWISLYMESCVRLVPWTGEENPKQPSSPVPTLKGVDKALCLLDLHNSSDGSSGTKALVFTWQRLEIVFPREMESYIKHCKIKPKRKAPYLSARLQNWEIREHKKALDESQFPFQLEILRTSILKIRNALQKEAS